MQSDIVVRGALPFGMSRVAIAQIVETTLSVVHEHSDVALAIVIVGDSRIKMLNREYRGKDSVTDVLSFGYDEGEGEYDVNEEGILMRQIGDIIISLPQVKRQAKSNGRRIAQEFAIMVVHGILHLLGYDHETEEQEHEMFSLQNEVLFKAGIL